MSESGLIARIAARAKVRPGVRVGIGDDAAVFDGSATMVAAHDMLVDGVHFRPGTRSWADVGHTALAVNLSDLAAMGAEPVCALVGLTMPPTMDAQAVDELYTAMDALAAEHGCTIAGGDTSTGATMTIGVTAIGRMVDRATPVLRSGGRPGDLLVVTGALGASAAGLQVLSADLDVPFAAALAQRHRRPRPLVAEGRILAATGVSAMLDCSDGLAIDVSRLADASGCAAVIDLERVPVAEGVADVASALGREPVEFAATGGEDYELIVAVAPGRLAQVAESLPQRPFVVGRLDAGRGLRVVRGQEPVTLTSWGWSHDV